MLKFSTTIEKMIDEQTTGRSTTKQFVEYGSKRKLLDSGVLDERVGEYIKELRNAVAFHMHKDQRYLVIVMYRPSSRSHGYYVLDTQTLQIAEAESVRTAKQGILDLVAAEADKAANDDKAKNK